MLLFPIEFVFPLSPDIIFSWKMQIEMMFCTIITYLICFCCCYFRLVFMKNLRREKKAFGKFNFITFSWLNVSGNIRWIWKHFLCFWGAHWTTRGLFYTSLRYRARKMCLQISLFTTELKFLPYASTKTSVPQNS